MKFSYIVKGVQCLDKQPENCKSVSDTCFFSNEENILVFLQVVNKMIKKKKS